MAPAILLCLSIVILLVTEDAATITFVMLVLIPCTAVWWLAGWEAAVACASGYFIFWAVRQRLKGKSSPAQKGLCASEPGCIGRL